MNRCEKCGSYAFNLHHKDIAQGNLCDVHYWQGKAETARRDALEEAASKFDEMAKDIPVDSYRYWNAVEVVRALRNMARIAPDAEL